MNESIMKSDRRGRLRYTPEQKKTHVWGADRQAFGTLGLRAPRLDDGAGRVRM